MSGYSKYEGAFPWYHVFLNETNFNILLQTSNKYLHVNNESFWTKPTVKFDEILRL